MYLGCGLLVVIYVNLFPVWKIISDNFSNTIIKGAPFVITIFLTGGLTFFFYRRRRKNKAPIHWIFVISGLAICFFALFIPDPKIIAKKIHVPEYILLSLYVRYVMSHKMQHVPLLLFSCLFTIILGIHDEFLQAVHPRRTYGLKDLLVNGAAGTGAGFIWHGFNLFKKKLPGSPPLHKKSFVHFIFLFWLLLSLLGLIFPLFSYRSYEIPSWPFFPLTAAFLFYFCLLRNDNSDWSHGLLVISCSSSLLLLYPLLLNSVKMVFY